MPLLHCLQLVLLLHWELSSNFTMTMTHCANWIATSDMMTIHISFLQVMVVVMKMKLKQKMSGIRPIQVSAHVNFKVVTLSTPILMLIFI